MSSRSLNSSSASSRASRSLRLLAEIRRAVAVMLRTGRSSRPATYQPSRMASKATMARAISELTRRRWRSDARCAASSRSDGLALWAVHRDHGVDRRQLADLDHRKATLIKRLYTRLKAPKQERQLTCCARS